MPTERAYYVFVMISKVYAVTLRILFTVGAAPRRSPDAAPPPPRRQAATFRRPAHFRHGTSAIATWYNGRRNINRLISVDDSNDP
jgi:hypothetical protein